MGFYDLINDSYKSASLIEQMREHFEQSQPRMIRLNDFFVGNVYKKILNELKSAEGMRVKVADRYSFTLLELQMFDDVFSSQTFMTFLGAIIGKQIAKINYQIRSFEKGDYTLLHDSEAILGRVEFFFVFAEKWKGNAGGMKVYIQKKGEGKPVIFPVEGNSFSIIDKKDDMHSFVKYVNNLAGKGRMFIVEGWVE